jgi:hypothetical protein
MVLTALVECLAVVALGLVYMWSAGGMREPNATLAAFQHVHFLGQDTWPIGVLIVIGAAVFMLRLIPSLLAPARAIGYAARDASSDAAA